jgi:hypothetical protein
MSISDIENHLLVMCYNTRSLHVHISDVSEDHFNLLSDVLILQETWEVDGDDLDYTIPGFTHVCKGLATDFYTRPHRGI